MNEQITKYAEHLFITENITDEAVFTELLIKQLSYLY